MTPEERKLLNEAMKLPESQRADLAARLIDSLDLQTDADAAEQWDSEIARRIAELDSGAVEAVPWPESRARLMRRLNDSSAA